MKRVGSEDVARLAGVSRSTVSRVFTPGLSVSAEARDRVEEAARMLGYQPNVIARSLSKRRTGLVGLVVGDLESPAYARLVARIADGVQNAGLATLLFVARYNEVDRVIRSLMAYQVDTLVVASALPTPAIAVECAKDGRPLILVNRSGPGGATHAVAGDNHAGAALVARHFAQLGRRRPAFLAGIEGIQSSVEREAGFALALAREGLVLRGREAGHYEPDGARAAMRRLLSAPDRPDAVFCANDTMAVAAMDVAREEFGLRIGADGDLAVAGYDDSPVARLASYRLTSVDPRLHEIADRVVDLAVAAVRDGAEALNGVVVTPRLVVRSSSGPPDREPDA